MNDFKLCFVEGNRAWFTDVSLKEQDGEKWYVPYLDNAGWPYDEHKIDGERVKHNIVRIFFERGCLENPPMEVSVNQINAGNIAWLFVGRDCEHFCIEAEPIFAGVSIETFDRLVRQAGGKVYYPVSYEQYVKSVLSDDID